MLTLMRFIKLRRKLLIYNDKKQSFITFIIIITLFTLFNIVAYLLPIFIFSGASWSFILSWLPSYPKWLIASIYFFVLMVTVWLSLIILTKQSKSLVIKQNI